MLRNAESAREGLASEMARIEAEAGAMRAILDRDEARFVPVEFVARRIATLDQQKGATEGEMRKVATRVLHEARRLKLFEKAWVEERRRDRQAIEAAELGKLIERIASGE